MKEETTPISGPNVSNLKDKLDLIRKNKTLLEEKIREYETKLVKQ
jgi:hypothetical protein